MTAAEREIADLDAALAQDGQPITLRRVLSVDTETYVDVTCQAFVRGYQPNELVNGITQQDRSVILSPTQINAAEWPGDDPVSVEVPDARIPSRNRGDKCVIDTIECAVQSAQGIWIGSTLVRIDMRVRGLA